MRKSILNRPLLLQLSVILYAKIKDKITEIIKVAISKIKKLLPIIPV